MLGNNCDVAFITCAHYLLIGYNFLSTARKIFLNKLDSLETE